MWLQESYQIGFRLDGKAGEVLTARTTIPDRHVKVACIILGDSVQASTRVKAARVLRAGSFLPLLPDQIMPMPTATLGMGAPHDAAGRIAELRPGDEVEWEVEFFADAHWCGTLAGTALFVKPGNPSIPPARPPVVLTPALGSPAVEALLARFDFQKCRDHMVAMDWEWGGLEGEPAGVPSIEVMKAEVRRIVHAMECSPADVALGCGGFVVLRDERGWALRFSAKGTPLSAKLWQRGADPDGDIAYLEAGA